jgi:hypothetical protein
MTTNAFSNLILRLTASDPTLVTINIDHTWIAINVLHVFSLLGRRTSCVKKLTVDVGSIIETCGEVVVQRLVDTLSKNESMQFVKFKNCDVGAYIKLERSVQTSQLLKMHFWLNLNKLLASNQIPMSVWPHIFSKLSASGHECLMFQLLKEKNDVLIESRSNILG